MHMPEKFTVEQKEQIVIESFTATNIAELCRRHGVSVAQFHSSTDGRNGILKEEEKDWENHQGEMNTRRRLMISRGLLVIRPL